MSQPPPPKRTPKLYQTARISSLATSETPSADDANVRLSSVDAGVLSRIKKSLALAQHAGTGEAEARQALRLATRLMASQNLTQADLIATESQEQSAERAGMSEVLITSTTGSSVRNESWANRIAVAINLFFSVKAYSTSHVRRDRLTWTFYGLALNTVAAAHAFEMVHNQVLTWAAENKQAKGKTGKNSYCQGVAAGLVAMAKEEQEQELRIAKRTERRRIKQEEKRQKEERQREMQRLSGPVKQERSARVEEEDVKPAIKRSPSPLRSFKSDRSPSPFGNRFDAASDEEDVKPDFDEAQEPDIIDLTNDSDEDVKPTIKPEPLVKEEVAAWRDSGQLILFRNNAEKIAEVFLKAQHGDIKLRKRTARSYTKDSLAYEQGRRDAKKIDVKRRRIEIN